MTKPNQLNIPGPIADRIAYSGGVMLAGIGGGYDICGGLPLFYEWPTLVKAMANYSSKSGIFSRVAQPGDDPEYLLSTKVNVPVYLIGREGVQTVRRGYEEILKKHQDKISTIFLIDGGVDSLMRGDETGGGTVLEDFISMSAIAQLDIPCKYLVCIGFGAETEEGVCHYRALENMAGIIKDGGFLGCCALTKNMDCFKSYDRTCRAVMKESKRKSHIHSRIIPAVEGEFGNHLMYEDVDARVAGATNDSVFVNPFMPIMWFFDFEVVARRNLLLNKLKLSGTFTDAKILYREFVEAATRRTDEKIPW